MIFQEAVFFTPPPLYEPRKSRAKVFACVGHQFFRFLGGVFLMVYTDSTLLILLLTSYILV